MEQPQDQFGALIQQFEAFSKRNPQGYRLRVGLYAALGYAYIFLMLAGLLALIGFMVWLMVISQSLDSHAIKILIVLIAVTGLMLKSLWISFPKPDGVTLNRQQVPQLFALVDQLTQKLQAPRLHNILLTAEFNAAVVQVPRLGILGWQENYLLLGLPLLQSLSLEQFQAVLAHEFGHLSGNPSRFAAWIYRIRKTWMQLYERLHQRRQVGSALFFNTFLKWYWPTFNAYSFALARINEYEADQCAAQLMGAQSMAEALIHIEVKAKYLDESFWPGVYDQVGQQPDPPKNVYSYMLRCLSQTVNLQQGQKWLQKGLQERTDHEDPHPCLADRLESLGYQMSDAHPQFRLDHRQTSAAQMLLGNTIQEFVQQFDRDWYVAAATPWRQRFAYLADMEDKLDGLEQAFKARQLTDQEAWERAYYTLEVKDEDAALPLLQEVLERQPDHAAANYALGQVLLKKKDAAGIACIEKAIDQRNHWVIDGCELLSDFFHQLDQVEQAQKYLERAERHQQRLQKARTERATVFEHDQFKPHTLDQAEIDALIQQVQTYPQVREAYLVEKVVELFPEKRFCVMGIVCTQALLASETAAKKLIEQLVNHLQFPTEAYIVILNHPQSGKLGKKICQIEQSLLFRRQ
ncbi:M48 family metallopeptidase [Acaryochloris sp. IP29b_bin.137]|uniref:M48 family metallopeptidase n=1 Tax=Acaryochloris sp. IP29b_bin.137 TaxID=2969217 RepID=UPI0026123A23|nr:M48 family metallopeptidase [Acaryochloris sp. IP29b_bin.137]